MKRKQQFYWLAKAVGGLVLTGMGLSMSIDAGFERFHGSPWIVYGTVALIVFQSGLCLMIDSLRHRINMES